MPTIKPLPGQTGGDGEGQLKPIAAATHRPSPAPPAPAATTAPATPAATAPQSKPQAAPTQQHTAPQPPAAHRLKPRIGTGPRINRTPDNHTGDSHAAAATTAAAQQPERTAAYTDEALQGLWDAYIAAHPQEVILVNTMRASRPRRTAEGADSFTVTVENEAQQAKMTESLPEIVSSLRNGLSNDRIAIAIEVNHGEGGSHTWNEREVLAHMLENNPALQGFIDEFKLNLG